MISWYATYCRSNFEGLVARQLERSAVETYWPHRPRKGWQGRIAQDSVFPGYLFARLDLAVQDTRPVLDIPQVVRILGFLPGQPVAIPDSEIETIRIMVDSPLPLTVATGLIHPGDQVRVRRGPLRGSEGVVAFEGRKCRLVVVIAMLGQSVSVPMDLEDVEVIGGSKRVA